MPFVALFSFLSSIVGPLAAKILTAIGIGTISYVGINLMLAQVKDFIVSSFGSASQDILMIFGLAKVDVAINIVLAAITARALLSGLNSATGSISKLGSLSK
ncbi:MAG: hypothetical protein CVV09_04990 [Gammaproteobacteria bacterium HGW-Gammaproteobacteria-13]|nr:MAG: hypothetical protein CVV09_04990 [Gammaproteobacteria bacterium HGW-Gammaproteobacteria-13]